MTTGKTFANDLRSEANIRRTLGTSQVGGMTAQIFVRQ